MLDIKECIRSNVGDLMFCLAEHQCAKRGQSDSMEGTAAESALTTRKPGEILVVCLENCLGLLKGVDSGTNYGTLEVHLVYPAVSCYRDCFNFRLPSTKGGAFSDIV